MARFCIYPAGDPKAKTSAMNFKPGQLARGLTPAIAEEIIRTHTEEYVSPSLCAEPLVSVAVLTYQHAKYIKQCMDGILMQKTDFPFEVVVGDDGSTDGAFEILHDYQKKYPGRIRLFRSTPNMGQYTRSPRLNGMRNRQACRGKYYTMIEGDDYWTAPDKLQRQLALLEANPKHSSCFHDVEIVGERWQGQKVFKDYGDKTQITFEDQLTLDMPGATGSVLSRADRPIWPKWSSNAPYGDRLKFSLLTYEAPMLRIPEKMGVYRMHEGGITASEQYRSFEHYQRVIDFYFLQKTHFGDRGKEFFAMAIRCFFWAMLQRWKADRKKRLFRMPIVLRIALRMGPSNLVKFVHERKQHLRNASEKGIF